MANLICVRLNKGDAPSWGFRLQGGKDFGTPLVVQKVIGSSPAERAGLIAGDTVVKINNTDVYNLRHKDAQDVILRAGSAFDVTIQRGGSTWKPSVTPVGVIPSPRPAAPVNHISPVTTTSLAAGRQESIGAIGTSHNVSAKPFHQVNGGPKLVNKQYNSPLPLYSDQSIAETLSAQTEVLANGVLGVNFKKNEKSYDAANSEVFRMVQEADKEPRDYEPEPDTSSSGVVSAPLGVAGLRHVPAPENKPAPPTPQLPPGQNICADCERLIVGVFVRIKDKNLHVECFKCSTCGTSLKNVGYYNLNNKLYCDIHAKLAARNNPPAPNLQPITVPPGGKIPSGTISAALSSHSLPSPSSLSPNTNYSAAPFQPSTNYSSPRPFSSVTAPLSPSSHTPKLSPTTTPFTGRSGVKPSTPYREKSGVQNIVWPPISTEPEIPTASPLYFPPPSQVQTRQKNSTDETIKKSKDNSESEYNDQEEMNYIKQYTEDRNMSLCSAEVYNITERRSAVESSETIADTLDTQILVESIVQSRPKSPLPIVHSTKKPLPSGDVNVSFTISEAELKKGFQNINGSVAEVSQTSQIQENKTCLKETQSHSLASMYEKKIKVENTVPHKWESPMVTALTVASDKPYSDIPETLDNVKEPHTFLEIPVKKPSTALGAALAVAPSEPFRPTTLMTLEPVPLPEETIPYFPPEHPILPKTQDDEPDKKTVKTKVYGKKKAEEKDDIFKDLPTPPPERISMLAALTTAPDRPYSPFNPETVSSVTSTTVCNNVVDEKCVKVVDTHKKTDLQVKKKEIATKTLDDYPIFKNTEKPMIKSYVSFPTTKVYSMGASAAETTHSVSSDLSKEEIKTTVAEQTSEASVTSESTKNLQTTENITNIPVGLPPMIQVVRSTFETNTDKVQMEMSCQFLGDVPHQVVEKRTTTTDVSEQKSTEKVSNEKVKETIQSTHKKNQSKSNNTIAKVSNKEIKSLDSCGKSCNVQQTSSAQTQSKTITLQKERDLQETAIKEKINVILPGQTNLNVPKISFQPVNEDSRSNTTFSPRPRSLTPSMINKPPPILPYYQSSLVATECTAAETNIFDPKSPAVSRSPSPYPGRPASPFLTPSSSARPVSPAQGPPPNPLESKKSLYAIKQEGKVLEARSHVKSFIPQHQNKVGTLVHRAATVGRSEAYSENYDEKFNTSVKQHAKATCEIDKLEGLKVECFNDGHRQTQRKTHVSEEYEHTQKSKTIEVKKFSSSSQVSEVQQASKVAEQAVGFHITNPQPLKSPFLNAIPDSSSPAKTDSDASTQSKIPKKIIIPIQSEKPTASTPSTATTSNKNVIKPGVSQPNVGSGGGRQAGAIGVAPKRGRGILNLAATPGSRVPLCAQCNANIRGPFITALGKIWCPDHFICATPSCRRPLHDLGFVEERGQLYCEYCFEQYLAPPCSKCNAKIKGDCLKAIGRNFHPECFNCVYCGKLFGNSPFFLEDAQPYCEADWNELFTTKCFACGFPVEAGDRWVEALNNNYHSQCFNCTMCKKNLEGQSFFAKGGRPFCKNHAR